MYVASFLGPRGGMARFLNVFGYFSCCFAAVLEASEGVSKLLMVASDRFYQKLTLPGPYVSFSDTETTENGPFMSLQASLSSFVSRH